MTIVCLLVVAIYLCNQIYGLMIIVCLFVVWMFQIASTTFLVFAVVVVLVVVVVTVLTICFIIRWMIYKCMYVNSMECVTIFDKFIKWLANV